MSMSVRAEAEEYHSKDFEWETLEQEIENNPSLHYHFLPFPSSQQQQQQKTLNDSDAWRKFHNRHSAGRFFKERRYLLKEFPELVSCGESSKLLEVGCGSGSTILPILHGNKDIIVYACDCSSEILERTKEFVGASDIASVKNRFFPFYCDFCTTGFPDWLACNYCRGSQPQKQHDCFSDVEEINIPQLTYLSRESGSSIGGVDFVTLIFTLSAVPLQGMPTALIECYSVLKPGGLLFFRDYGLYDMTMLRFQPDQRVGFREYMRSDGTRSYFFSLDAVRNLFVGVGFIEVELEYCCVKSLNRRNAKSMQRVWIHGKFKKPM
ncbi:tRNA N(3)-methylcytidine methyltransferase METTL6 isoform X1 [Mangifera indica]|uniref:tRNA N(3)-methylcytidine methyltransferase METTL6 isoform X1 n=1 Tax=Mangifera indica TaxID=29780 RepID=UPI001CFC0E58|nr:tRNA N(3)-methylcytidine methyltransferase METTL6 isoform X1 [Mangifera indica]XP_044483603.1 tRNA N(3)-methylcytidine methyltransferase METTL6 isoform X1 [Mangifera indica]